MTTDPGAVPREATPLPEDDEVLCGGGGGSGGLEEGKGGAEGQSGNGGGIGRRVRKYCRRCNAFKPPRAHHCSICRRCVVKMVRECPRWWDDGGVRGSVGSEGTKDGMASALLT